MLSRASQTSLRPSRAFPPNVRAKRRRAGAARRLGNSASFATALAIAPWGPAPTVGPDACKVWEIKTLERKEDGKARTMLEKTVGPGRYCPRRHPTHSAPLFLELNGILCRGGQYLPCPLPATSHVIDKHFEPSFVSYTAPPVTWRPRAMSARPWMTAWQVQPIMRAHGWRVVKLLEMKPEAGEQHTAVATKTNTCTAAVNLTCGMNRGVPPFTSFKPTLYYSLPTPNEERMLGSGTFGANRGGGANAAVAMQTTQLPI